MIHHKLLKPCILVLCILGLNFTTNVTKAQTPEQIEAALNNMSVASMNIGDLSRSVVRDAQWIIGKCNTCNGTANAVSVRMDNIRNAILQMDIELATFLSNTSILNSNYLDDAGRELEGNFKILTIPFFKMKGQHDFGEQISPDLAISVVDALFGMESASSCIRREIQTINMGN